MVTLLPNKPLEIQWERFSSWTKLIHTICYILRWRRRNQNRGVISLDEYHNAERITLKLIQKESFTTEYDTLVNGKELSCKSNIAQLCPFIDNQGTMRARGRLSKADIEFDTKHPILLPSKHPETRLMMPKRHLDKYHQGVEIMRHGLQQKYWILGLKNALRNIKSRFVPCRIYSAVVQVPIMADLPREKVEKVDFPFTYVGVDYFGPIEVKYMRKILKRWVCVFTCLSTRAIHLEMVYSLDTDSCVSAVLRFIARRGHPLTIWSDNGTNFVGANNELKQFASMWQNNYFQEKLRQKKIVWKFNPAAAPHFGGSWERMVKTCIQAIYHVLNGQRLTDELLVTILCLTEQLLNSRPLTPNSNDPSDMEVLTPHHFLLGRPSVAIPYLPDAQKYQNHRKMFRVAQAHMDKIWARWLKEYLPVHNIRQKWYKERPQLKENDLVWIIDHRKNEVFTALVESKGAILGMMAIFDLVTS